MAILERSNESNGLAAYKTNRFQLSELALEKKPLRSEAWFPEHLTPWAFLPSYASLPREVQLRYNQLYALGTNEAFIALERDFICRILRDHIAAGSLSGELLERMESFVEEEEKHAEMFYQVNRAAEPAFYLHTPYFVTSFQRLSPIFWLQQMGAHHELFAVWPWIAIFFEERSLMYSKEHLRAGGRTAALFVQCHKFHMLEELYHVQIDELIIDEFYSARSRASRFVASKMLESIVRSYTMPRRLSHMIAQQLRAEFLGVDLAPILSELPLLAGNKDFMRANFGPDATKRFRRLLAKYPEMARVEKLIAL